MTHRNTQQRMEGFTIVEMTIAMMFVAFLLVAIAGAIIQIGNIYNKGVTLKSVDQAGRIVVQDMQQTVSAGGPFNPATAYKIQSGSGGVVQGGRFCTGIYSYIWNIGTQMKTDDKGNAISEANYYSGTDKTTPIRLVKDRDTGGTDCIASGGAYPVIDRSNSTELFSDNSLTVQCFQINQAQCDSSNTNPPLALTKNTSVGTALYTISMIIGNADSEAIDTTDNTCKAPDLDTTYQNYCAVNEFDFTVQAGNKGGQ